MNGKQKDFEVVECLNCGGKFKSEDRRTNRICYKCKNMHYRAYDLEPTEHKNFGPRRAAK